MSNEGHTGENPRTSLGDTGLAVHMHPLANPFSQAAINDARIAQALQAKDKRHVISSESAQPGGEKPDPSSIPGYFLG